MEQVGRYRILSPLGRGAMGVVYLADDPLLHRQVAVKTIDLSIDDPARREFLRGRLLRDARAAAALLHPNIVSIFDVVTEGDVNAVIMEYVAGENLAAYLARNPAADPAFTLHIVTAMAAALDYTHARGVIHRDIKPANVMLDAAQTPKITDFGIARMTEGVTTTMTGAIMGTIEYMAPEQVKGEPLDGRADQFALAVIAYRMLTGTTVFGEHSLTTLAYKIVHEPAPPIRARLPWLPPATDAALAKALAKTPVERYDNCGAFAAALTAALTGINRDASTVAISPAPAAPAAPITAATAPLTAPTAPTTAATAPMMAAAQPAPPRRSNLALGVAVGLAFIAAAAGLAFWKPWGHAPQQPPVTSATVAPQPAAVQPAASEKPPEAPPHPKAETSPKTEPKKIAKTTPEKVEASNPPGVSPPTTVAPQPGPAAIDPDEVMDRGRVAMVRKDYPAALQAFTKAVDLRPNWAQAYHNRGNVYVDLKQYDAAMRDFDRAIQLNPGVFTFYLSRGICYIKLQQDDRALADLNQAISMKADAPVALFHRAGIFMRRKDFQKAQADWTEVIRLQPENMIAYRQRALARRQLGDRTGARDDVQKANEIAAKKGG